MFSARVLIDKALLILTLGGVLSFCSALMAATAFAQTPPEPVVPGPDAEYPDAKVVNTTTGTGNKQSPIFSVQGESFRITTTLEATSQDPELAGVTVNVRTEDDEAVTSFDKEGPGTESSLVNAGPGGFFLDLNTANANYAVTVEDSVGDDSGNGNDNGNDTVSGDNNNDTVSGDNNNDDGDIINVPDKPLPKTGGAAPVSMPGVLAYGSAFLVIPMVCITLVFLAGRFKDRRGS